MIPRRVARNLLLVVPFGLLSGCVWKSDYDALQEQNNQLQAQNATNRQQIASLDQQVTRLQGAIKYTINSDQLFAPGSWQMSNQGKQIIARFASQLASTQTNPIVVNGYTDNTPIGSSLRKKGVTSNEMLSQKRAEAVKDYLISKGVNAELVTAKGWGEAQPVAPNDNARDRAMNRRVEIGLATSGT